MYMIEIFLGVVLYEQLFRRPIGGLPSYIQFIKHAGIYYSLWNSVFVAVILHIVSIAMATYGEQPEKVGIVTIAGASFGMLLFVLAFFKTFDSTTHSQRDTKDRFLKAYCTEPLPKQKPIPAWKWILGILCFPVTMCMAKKASKGSVRELAINAIDPLTCADLKPEWKKWLGDHIKAQNE